MIEYHSYKIVQGHKDTFIKDVNEHLKAGYVPLGGVCVLPPGEKLLPQEDFYFQAMALRSVAARKRI